MSIFSRGSGCGGKKYEGETIITPGDAVVKIPAGTLLKDGLTIKAVQAIKGTATPSDVLQNFKPPAGKYFNEFDVEKVPKSLKHGKYAWRKAEVLQPRIEVVNPRFTMTLVNPPFVYELTNPNFDFTKIVNWREFLNGFAYGSYSFYISGGNFIISSGSSSMSVDQFTVVSPSKATLKPSAARFNGPATCTFNGTKLIQELSLKTVGFVVSDDETDYPNGYGDDGYYYQLLGRADSLNIMSLSDDALYTVQDDTIYGLIEEGVIR